MAKRWEEYKPAVDKTILILIAGIVWIMAGLMLSRLAVIWWQNYTGTLLSLFIFVGILLGVVKGYFILTRVVRANIRRINQLSRTGFVLAFISLKTYLLIIGMMTMGMFLRHTSFPRQYLAILYLGVGIAMIISSYPYFKGLMSGEFNETVVKD